MIKTIVFFLLITVIVFLAIQGFQKMTGKQALDLTKTAIYAILSSSVAVLLMILFVELF